MWLDYISARRKPNYLTAWKSAIYAGILAGEGLTAVERLLKNQTTGTVREIFVYAWLHLGIMSASNLTI